MMEHCGGCGIHQSHASGMQGCEGGGIIVKCENGGGMEECESGKYECGLEEYEGSGMEECGGGGLEYLELGRSGWELQESALHHLAEVAEKKKQQVRQ